MDGWYYKVSDTEQGPVALEKLIELAKAHSLKHDDVVRFGQKGQWRRVGTIGQLMAHLPYQPAGSQQSQFGSTMFSPSAPPSSSDTIPVTTSTTSSSSSSSSPSHVDPKQFERRWWCKIQNREFGPVEMAKLVEWVASGRLHRDDPVRFGNDPYILARDLPELFPDKLSPGSTATPPVQKAS